MHLLFIIPLGPAQKSLFKMHPQLLTAHSTGRCGVVLFPFQGNSGVKIVSLLNKQWSKAKVANEFLKARAVSGELNHPGGWGAGEKYTSEDRSDICINLMFIEDPKCNESLQTSGFYKPWAGTLSWKASNAKTVNVNSGFPASLKTSSSWLLAAERIFISSPSTNPHLTCSLLETSGTVLTSGTLWLFSKATHLLLFLWETACKRCDWGKKIGNREKTITEQINTFS